MSLEWHFSFPHCWHTKNLTQSHQNIYPSHILITNCDSPGRCVPPAKGQHWDQRYQHMCDSRRFNAFQLKCYMCSPTCFLILWERNRISKERILNPWGHKGPQNTETNLLNTRMVLSLTRMRSVCRLISGTSEEIEDFTLLLTSVKALLWNTAILRGCVNVPTKTSAPHIQHGIFKIP